MTEIPERASDVLRPSESALLLWDLQNGLGGHATDLAGLRPKWKDLLARAKASGVLVLRSKHVAPPMRVMRETEVWRIMRRQGVRNASELRPYMQPGTEDARFLDGFEPGPDEIVIEKSTPSLFIGTAADDRLRGAHIRSLVLAGVATDIGIEFTARHALALGYYPIVVTDAVGSYSQEAQERGLACVSSFAMVETTEGIVRAWSEGRTA
jgi:nicotinamidase-related amidase